MVIYHSQWPATIAIAYSRDLNARAVVERVSVGGLGACRQWQLPGRRSSSSSSAAAAAAAATAALSPSIRTNNLHAGMNKRTDGAEPTRVSRFDSDVDDDDYGAAVLRTPTTGSPTRTPTPGNVLTYATYGDPVVISWASLAGPVSSVRSSAPRMLHAGAGVHDERDLRARPFVRRRARAVFFCFCVSICDGDRSVFFFFFSFFVVLVGLP